MKIYSVAIGLLFAVLGILSCGGESKSSSAGGVAEESMTQEQVAVSQLTQALASDPDNAELYAERGAIYMENGVFDRAIIDFKRSLERDSSRVAVWHLLADAQMDNLRSRDALTTMIYASSKFKERMPTLLKLAEFQFIVEKHDDALATLDRAVKVNPNEGEVFFMIGEVLSEKMDTVRAINAYQRATELNPDILDAWLALGILFEARGNNIAERYFKTATAIDRKAAIPYRMLADYYSRQNRLPEAIAQYDEAINRDPQYDEAFYNSGLVYLDMDNTIEAKEQFDRAVEVRPDYIEARFYQGVALELQGNVQQARQAYQQALNLDPSLTSAQQALERLQAAK
ncbi:MAG: tetratricopeptide repeat protein [Saprospiraceae bacterium]